MSKRIILSDHELRIIGVTLKAAIKDDDYYIKNSLIVGKLGHEEMLMLLERLGLGDTDLVATDSEAKKSVANPPKTAPKPEKGPEHE